MTYQSGTFYFAKGGTSHTAGTASGSGLKIAMLPDRLCHSR
jgi:hypothetical protein